MQIKLSTRRVLQTRRQTEKKRTKQQQQPATNIRNEMFV